MALSDNALTTIAACEEALTISSGAEDTYLTRLIEIASEQIQQYCNRKFYYEADIVEYVPGFGDSFLVVSRRPILTLTSVYYSDAEVSSDDYKCTTEEQFANSGRIYNAGGWYWPVAKIGNIAQDVYPGSEDPLYKITYTAGYVTPEQAGALSRSLPFDIEQACIDLVVLRYRAKGRDPAVLGEKLLSWSVQYAGVDGYDEGIPAPIAAVLKKYRTPVMA